MPIWQLCANLLIPNCLRSNLSYSPLAALEFYVNFAKVMLQGDELSTYLRSMSSEKISQIEISHNPNASFGSEGAGGVINIILNFSESTYKKCLREE